MFNFTSNSNIYRVMDSIGTTLTAIMGFVMRVNIHYRDNEYKSPIILNMIK